MGATGCFGFPRQHEFVPAQRAKRPRRVVLCEGRGAGRPDAPLRQPFFQLGEFATEVLIVRPAGETHHCDARRGKQAQYDARIVRFGQCVQRIAGRHRESDDPGIRDHGLADRSGHRDLLADWWRLHDWRSHRDFLTARITAENIVCKNPESRAGSITPVAFNPRFRDQLCRILPDLECAVVDDDSERRFFCGHGSLARKEEKSSEKRERMDFHDDCLRLASADGFGACCGSLGSQGCA